MLPVHISSICNLRHIWFGFLFSVYGISRVIKKDQICYFENQIGMPLNRLTFVNHFCGTK